MTNDKALEAAFNVIWPATEWNDGEHACRETVRAAISAYLSALPGEAEVVVYATPHAIADFKAGAIGVRHGLYGSPIGLANVPLVTLASFQAMQARAEAAEREGDAAQQAVDAFSDICVELGVERDNEAGIQAAHDLKARVKELEEALEPIASLVESHDDAGVAYLRATQQEEAAKLSYEELAELFAPAKEAPLTDGAMRNPTRLTWGQLRRARTALKGGSNG